MWQGLFDSLAHNSFSIITMGGAVNPYLGLGLLVAIGGALIFFSVMAKKEAWNKQKDESSSSIGKEVGQDQEVNKNVDDKINDFLGGK